MNPRDRIRHLLHLFQGRVWGGRGALKTCCEKRGGGNRYGEGHFLRQWVLKLSPLEQTVYIGCHG